MNYLPDGWSLTTLGRACHVSPTDPALPADAPFVPMASVDVGSRYPRSFEPRGARGGVRARSGDVLFARITPCLENGKVAQVPPSLVAVGGSTEFIVLRPGPEVDPGFLYYWCLEPGVRAKAQRMMAGATGRMRLSGRDLAKFPFPLPPLEEQRRIVDILEDHVSRLDAADQLLAASGRRLKSFNQAALEVVTHRGSVDIVPLADLVERIEAGKSFGSASRPAGDDEWGIIKVSAMTWGQFRPSENKVVGNTARVDPRHEIRSGDLLVSRANTTEYVGAPVLVGHTRPKLLLSDKSLRLVPRAGWDPEYLLLLLSAPSARAQMSAMATGTKDSMRNISQGALLSIQVPQVQRSEQANIIATARAMTETASEQSAAVEHARKRSSTLRRSLLASAFSGRLAAGSSFADLKVTARV